MVIQIVLGFYENELKNIALDLASEISYKKHKQELLNIYNTFNITEEIINGDESINPSEDCDIIIKELRKLLKRIISIYEEHDLNINIVTGYEYYKN